MTKILKYLSSLVLVLALIGCQNDTDETAEQTPQQAAQQQQQPDQMGQMQQQAAPDIDVSDDEAEQFVDAAMDAQEVQMEAQKKMIGVIEEEGLDVETYQKIAQSNQMGQSPQGQGQGQGQDEQSDISEGDMEKFESVSESLQEMQGEIQQEVVAAVENAGMEMQRFQQISQAAQQDPELRKTIQSKMQEKAGGMQQQMQSAPSDSGN